MTPTPVQRPVFHLRVWPRRCLVPTACGRRCADLDYLVPVHIFLWIDRNARCSVCENSRHFRTRMEGWRREQLRKVLARYYAVRRRKLRFVSKGD